LVRLADASTFVPRCGVRPLPELSAARHEASLGRPQPIALFGEPRAQLLRGLRGSGVVIDGLPVSHRPGIARADPHKSRHPDERQGGQDEDDGEAHAAESARIPERRYQPRPYSTDYVEPIIAP
jgi:hypothetical protein